MKPRPIRKSHLKEFNQQKPKFGGRCGRTGKVIFRTEKGALNRGYEILDGDTYRRESTNQFRAYVCEFCGFYHLTGKKDYMREATYVTRP